ncbi:MAG: DUF5615 family PIN-like protein, partial [Chloroflexota bacterium]|nr:DUF5615 family PIN-like protein [Chloroflexota bacterium]
MILGGVISRLATPRGAMTLKALDEHRELEGIDDPGVLALAAHDRRILITHNVQDFPDVLREWAEGGHEHAGCIILVGVRLDQFGVIIRCIEAAFDKVAD